MARIAKADVNRALKLAADTIVKAGGNDGRTSRADMKAALKTLQPKERALADIFFKFIDNRDFKKGAQVTRTDVTKAVAYAKQHMVAKYDLNNNGLSKSEISKMSLTGRRAVDLAKALKAAGTTGGDAGMSVADFKKAITENSKDLTYTSEADYSPEAISGKPANAQGVTEANVRAAFGAKLGEFYADDDMKLSDLAFELYSPSESASYIKDLGTPRVDDDEWYQKEARGFAVLNGLVAKNLTDVRVMRVGPKGDDGKLEQDAGLYGMMIIGKAKDGQLAGYMFGSVET